MGVVLTQDVMGMELQWPPVAAVEGDFLLLAKMMRKMDSTQRTLPSLSWREQVLAGGDFNRADTVDLLGTFGTNLGVLEAVQWLMWRAHALRWLALEVGTVEVVVR